MPAVLTDLVLPFLAFGLIARLWPCNRGQRAFLSRDMPDNLLYWLCAVVIYGGLTDAYIRAGASLFAPHASAAATAAVYAGYGWAARLPLAAQVLAVLVGMDVIQYWMHRAFHSGWLWPFHAIHHSAEELDWSTTYRNHPLNFALYSAGALALVRVVGFSPGAFLVTGLLNNVIGPLLHANVNWTFGPLRYVLVSPVYHRWHHVKDPRAHNRNFAPTFSVLDLMFGTFYMPKDELPADFGVEGVPVHFVAQLVYPFQVIARRLAAPGKTPSGEAAV